MMQEGANTYRVPVNQITDKASDTRYMMVNSFPDGVTSGDRSKSYRVRSSTVVTAFAGPVFKPAFAQYTHDQLHGCAGVTRFGGGSSGSTGPNDSYQSLLGGNSPGDPYYGYNGDIDYYYSICLENSDPADNYKVQP